MKELCLLSLALLFLTSVFGQSSISSTPVVVNETSVFGTYIEGAAVDSQGNFYTINYGSKKASIGRVRPDGTQEEFFPSPDGAAQFNSVRYSQGVLYVADLGMKRALVVRLDKTSYVFCQNDTFLAGLPNDLAVSKDGEKVYLSGQDWGADAGQLWLCKKNGSPQRLFSGKRTNGVALSPDDKTLYMSEARNQNGGPVSNILWKFDVNTDGTIKNQQVFYSFDNESTGSTDIDGVRTDSAGNVYVTRNGLRAVDVFSADGKKISVVKLSMLYPTNVEIGGGSDGKTAYVVGRCGDAGYGTGRGCVDKFQALAPGREWSGAHSIQPFAWSLLSSVGLIWLTFCLLF